MAIRSSDSNASSYRLASVLYRALEAALDQELSQRYDASILLRCLDLNAVEEADEDRSELRIRVDCRGLTQMPASLTVTSAGGNVYDVLCRVQEGSSHLFSYSLPSQSETDFSCAPYLGRDIATFLREELENRLGRLLLQSPVRPPTRMS